jgi:hypothetical protein
LFARHRLSSNDADVSLARGENLIQLAQRLVGYRSLVRHSLRESRCCLCVQKTTPSATTTESRKLQHNTGPANSDHNGAIVISRAPPFQFYSPFRNTPVTGSSYILVQERWYGSSNAAGSLELRVVRNQQKSVHPSANKSWTCGWRTPAFRGLASVCLWIILLRA